MEDVKLDDFDKSRNAADTGHSNQRRSKTDHEAPLDANAAIHEGHPIDDVAEEYPSVIRRTVIVIGVALALFCVSYQLDHQTGDKRRIERGIKY